MSKIHKIKTETLTANNVVNELLNRGLSKL